jgi:hypothetical protein
MNTIDNKLVGGVLRDGKRAYFDYMADMYDLFLLDCEKIPTHVRIDFTSYPEPAAGRLPGQ